jgi:hypothetical protein
MWKDPCERAEADSAHAHRGLHRGHPAEGGQAGRCHQGKKNQGCGSDMFIPDPDFYPSDLGSRIQKQQ